MSKVSLLIPSNSVNFALLLIASLLYLYNFTTGSDVVSLFVTVLLAIYLFGANKADLLPSMIYLSFLMKVMVYGNTYLSFFVVLAFFMRIVLDRSFKAQELMVYFIIYFLIHFISTGFGNLTIGRICEVLSFFLVLPAGYALKKCKSKDCVIYFILGFFVSTLFGFARRILPRLDKIAGDTDVTILENMTEANRFSGISNDSNFYAILAIVTLFVLLFKVNTSFQTQKSKDHIIISILSLLTFVLGVMTYSKSYVISAFFIFVVYYIRVKKLSLMYSIAVVCISIIVFYFFSSSINEIEGAYLKRFGDDNDIDIITSNRTIIWANYFKDISNFSFYEILFGTGMIHEGKAAAHNTYIQLFYEFGLIGIIANLLLLYKSKKVYIKEKLAKYSFVIIVLLAVLFFNFSGFTFSSTWAILTIMFICCRDYNVISK